jgi:MinD superfamily P-loop ATPase
LSSDLADRAVEFIQDAHVNVPDKPFYLHYRKLEAEQKSTGKTTITSTATRKCTTCRQLR